MRKLSKKKILMITFISAFLLMQTAFAADLASSKLVTGTQKLIQDITSVLVILSPAAGAAAAAYNMIRRSMADEQEGMKFKHQALVSIGCGVGGMVVSGLILVIASYYQ